jgi:hypothetical protein
MSLVLRGMLTIAVTSRFASSRARWCRRATGSGAIEAGIADKRAKREMIENFISIDLTIGISVVRISTKTEMSD